MPRRKNRGNSPARSAVVGARGIPRSKPTKVDRTAEELGQFLSGVDSNSLKHPEHASDPLLTAGRHSQHIGQQGRMVVGRIHMSYPHLNCYTVAVGPQLGGLIVCTAMKGASTSLFGPRDTSTYPPDTVVSVWYPNDAKWGYILGSLPALMGDGNFSFSDWIVQGGNTGIKRDKYYSDMITKLVDHGGTKDFSNHQPVDSNSLDWGFLTELGGGIHIDPFMGFFRVDESTGLYGFYHDQLMRLTGHNLDIMSGGHTEVYRDDEGENNYFRGETPYPWEILGAYSQSETVHKENENKDVHLKLAEGKFEPLHHDQQPFYRYQEYGGYLGQGRIRLMAIPPSESGLNRYGDKESLPVGVFREQISLDGSYALASAKHIIISKRTLIPAPKQIKLPEDYGEESDNSTNYKASGHYGEGEDHKVGDITVSGSSEFPQLVTVAGILDLHSYTFNWKNIHPFHYHKNDYEIAEEGESSGTITRVTSRPDFGRLITDMWLPRPTAKTLKVDHRYTDTEYFENMSHMTMTDDGSVVIQGGNGEEIRMVGGNIQISCPGNVMLQPGRSVVTMAGKDAIVRAKGAIDITSSDKDVRIKSERNLHMLAANGGSGGILLESRSVGDSQVFPSKGGDTVVSSGIVFKAKNSQIVGLGKDIFLRTGVDNGPYGAITLDAGKGKGLIQHVGRGVNYHMATYGSVRYYYGQESVTATTQFSAYRAQIGSPLEVDGHLVVDGSATFQNYVISVTGLIYSGIANSAMGRVVQPIDLQPWENQVNELEEHQQESQDAGERRWETFLVPKWYVAEKAGDEATQRKISFSLRNSEEYATENFKLPEMNWQVLAGDNIGSVWKERLVKYQDSREMMPWPGKDAWTGDTLLRFSQDELKLFDAAKGISIPRGDEYADSTYGDFTEASPNDSYKIISG